MSRNFLTFGTLAGVGAVGYYFYQAGGDPNRASKQFQNDVSSLQSKAKPEENSAKELGAKIDREAQRAKDTLSSSASDAQKRLEEARKSTGNSLMQGVDKFDKSVEEGASKAKSGISSWFGGK